TPAGRLHCATRGGKRTHTTRRTLESASLLQNLHVDRGGVLRRAMHLLACNLKVGVLRFEDVGHELLWVAIDEWEPGALDLHHDLVPLAETMMVPVQVDEVSIHRARHDRLGFFKTLAEPRTHRFTADEQLKTSQVRVLLHLFRIDIDEANDPIAV